MKKHIVLSMVYVFLFGCLVIVILTNDPAFRSRNGTYGRTDRTFTRVIIIPTFIPTMVPTITDAPTEPIAPTKFSVKPTNTPKLVQPTQPVATRITNEGLNQLINQQRSANNLGVYSTSTSSCEIADRRVVETLSNYSHTGLTYYVNLYGIGVGENLADGYPSNEAVVNAWMGSASHRANILSTKWQHSCVRMVGTHIVAVFTT